MEKVYKKTTCLVLKTKNLGIVFLLFNAQEVEQKTVTIKKSHLETEATSHNRFQISKSLFGWNGSVPLAHTNYHFLPF